METTERRLPVYLLLDCSESMVGEGIEAVRRGMNELLMDLCSDPYALETVWVSVITFADTAEQPVPLAELGSFRAPPLRVRPGTALGGAISLLSECIRREVRTHSATQKGDWRPLVFLLTDGVPTDEWRAAFEAARDRAGRPPNIVAIGCGPDADPEVLGQLSENVLVMGEEPEDFRGLFAWISASLSVASQSIGTSAGTPGAVSLAKIPPGLLEAPGEMRQNLPVQSQLFVAVRCCQTRRPYLIRYRLTGYGEVYEPVRTHPVDEDYFGGESSATGPDLSSGQIMGMLPCPYCNNEAAGKCPCATIFCCAPGQEEVVCPGCGTGLSMGGGGDVSIQGRMG